MSALLMHHVNHISRFESGVRILDAGTWRLLGQVELQREESAEYGSGRRKVGATTEMMQRRAMVVPESDYSQRPAAADWIAQSLDQRLTVIRHDAARRHLTAFMRTWPVKGARVYGGTKPKESVRRKIVAYERRHSGLDLWDAVRFRVVTSGLSELLTVTRAMLTEFQVVRVRNYYTRPRNGPDDPFRAIHIEVWMPVAGFVEIQVLTELREAVGQIDHHMVHKKSVPFIDQAHQRWLLGLSQAANVLEWERASKNKGDPSGGSECER